MFSNKLLLKYYQIFTVLLLIFTLVLCALMSFKSNYNKNNRYLYLTSNYEKCNPFLNSNNTRDQFTVHIDGIQYPKRIALYENETLNFECLNSPLPSSSSLPTILMWNKFRGTPNLKSYPYGMRHPFELLNCPVTNCELTNDHGKFLQSDMVLFHMRNSIKDMPPKRRDQRQRFVHVIFESPIHCHLCTQIHVNENVFNFTVGYHTHSPYMSQYWSDSGLRWTSNENDQRFNENRNYAQEKRNDSNSGFAVAIISNCMGFESKWRLDYIKEMRRYVNVTIIGRCGIQNIRVRFNPF